MNIFDSFNWFVMLYVDVYQTCLIFFSLDVALKISPEKISASPTSLTTSVKPTKITSKSSVLAGSLDDPKLHFCRHCDVLVVGEGVRKSATPTDKNVVFCSGACYLQHTISLRSQVARTEVNAGRVVNHRSSDPQSVQLDVLSPKASTSLPTSPCTVPKTPPQSKSTPISPRSLPAQPVVSSPMAAQPAHTSAEGTTATPSSNQEVSPAKEEKMLTDADEMKVIISESKTGESGREELRLTLKTGTRRRPALLDELVKNCIVFILFTFL